MTIHLNSHFAIGVIMASISHYFFRFNVLEYIIVLLGAFLTDFDVFFGKYAREHNHRMLISHSIIPSVVVIIIGLVFNWIALIFCGIGLFLHVFVDTFDWGTNLFYFPKKLIGLKLLITKDEFENLDKYLAKYKQNESFFDSKYYDCKVCLVIEGILFILMMVFCMILALEYILIVPFYFIGLFFHLSLHFNLKKIEAN
jgi:hypothetical protein